MPPSRSKLKSEHRLRAERQGRRAEAFAALFLQAQLYRILERRFKTPVGEIDLIAERFGTTVFVEVKARARAEGAEEALGKVNRRRLVRAAEYFLSRNPALAATPLRFDVIFLAPKTWPRHLRNAFGA
ncbi:MAG TPA: YraN family protein [Devosiaceae bacterium]|nr:YraN family protein [Devosiaceae bacterium]